MLSTQHTTLQSMRTRLSLTLIDGWMRKVIWLLQIILFEEGELVILWEKLGWKVVHGCSINSLGGTKYQQKPIQNGHQCPVNHQKRADPACFIFSSGRGAATNDQI